MSYFYLFCAIITEVIATTALKASDGFSKFLPSIIVVVGYSVSFYFLSLSLKTIPVGMAYAIWAGLGIVLIVIFGMIFLKQTPDIASIVGISFIILGVVIMNLFSKTIE